MQGCVQPVLCTQQKEKCSRARAKQATRLSNESRGDLGGTLKNTRYPAIARCMHSGYKASENVPAIPEDDIENGTYALLSTETLDSVSAFALCLQSCPSTSATRPNKAPCLSNEGRRGFRGTMKIDRYPAIAKHMHLCYKAL